METIKLNSPSQSYVRVCLAAALVLISCSSSVNADITWTGASNSSWGVSGNWDSGVTPVRADWVVFPATSGTVNFTSSSGDILDLRGIRQAGGTLNITGGELGTGELASAVSTLDGSVVQTGGLSRINAVRMGANANTNGSYELTGGEFRIIRGGNGVSLQIGGLSSGTGSVTIAGGSFLTRANVTLGGGSNGVGTFTVLGSNASEITIGGSGSDIDGTWEQHAGSSLVARFDNRGVTPIIVRDNSNDEGTSATFENGSILDVTHLPSGGGGTWTLLEVENGDITDNGLAFASSVDTSVWSFRVDNSGSNGRLLVTAAGDPVGLDLMVGELRQQRMRYGMDYERLWFWTSGLNASERDDIAKWSAIDTRIDYIRVAINAEYERDFKGDYDIRAYEDKIIPMMQEMKDANPDIKFFASPRPLHESYPSSQNVAWQPYPIWVDGTTSPSSGAFDFDWEKCAVYLEEYILLMKSYGFKISFMDLTNEWQSNVNGGRITQADFRDITEYLKANLDPDDVPQFIAPSAWEYSQGTSWINNLSSNRRREAVDIASCHNTNRDTGSGSAQAFADAVHNVLGTETEIWNTEVHGWKSTSSENETTSFYFYLEKIRAGFSGLNGWLAIGTTNQGHAYILNPSGTPRRNVKYYIFKKLSETSNYGRALDIVDEPEMFHATELNHDNRPKRIFHSAALIKGDLMTVWVINQGTSSVPLNISPLGRTISESSVKLTRWTDPDDVEGFVTHEAVTSAESFYASIPGESVCCFEILLDPENAELAYNVIQAEDHDGQAGLVEEQSSDVDESLNFGFISHDDFAIYSDVVLTEDSTMRFRIARPGGRADGWIEVFLLEPGASTGSILSSEPAGKIAVPETGGWQDYETIETGLENAAGAYDVVLRFREVGSTSRSSLFNLNWFSVVGPDAGILGDFDQDGDVDGDDLDWYNGNIGVAATGDLGAIDLDGNGVVGESDFHQHYETLVETSNGGKGTFAGDVNLDGTVNVLGDALVLVNNLGASVTSWSSGDVNADGVANVLGDALLMILNLGRSNDGNN